MIKGDLYSFNLEEVVPDDHLIRSIARVLDFSWVRVELAPLIILIAEDGR